MAHLVADVGGSSSRWGLVGGIGTEELFDGLPGYNPATGDPARFIEGLRSLEPKLPIVPSITIYGAGCGHADRAERMHAAVHAVWPSSTINVHSDLLGSARGMLGEQRGLVLILGTGMNAGHYDGRSLHLPMPSLGFILGDEGSGADIGKHFIADVLHGRVPQDIVQRIFPNGTSVAEVVEHVYRGNAPQAWLASHVAPLVALGGEYVDALLRSRFHALAAVLALHFPRNERTFCVATGSVAVGCEPLLRAALAREGFELSSVAASPMLGLLRYHHRAG